MSLARDELVAAIHRALEPIEAVRVAYLFGSRARGAGRPESDLDLAVAFRPGTPDPEREAARRRIVTALAGALGAIGDRADVVDLERVDSGVAFAALRDGVRTLARSEPERVRLEAGIARRYDDEAPRRALFREAARRAGRALARKADGRS
jgi:predicted nucleotidyltransferase